MQSDAGLSAMQTAKLFQVTPRTVQNWRSGATRPPGVVVHLLRIRSRWQVPCAGWDGWHFHSGKLWTPEGRPIGPQDGSWWSLLVRQARAFRSVYAQVQELRDLAREAWAAGYLQAPALEAQLMRDLRGAGNAPAEGGAGLVTSTNNVNTGVISPPQTEHGLTSCPLTPSDSRITSMTAPASGRHRSGSALMPSSVSPLRPISGQAAISVDLAPQMPNSRILSDGSKLKRVFPLGQAVTRSRSSAPSRPNASAAPSLSGTSGSSYAEGTSPSRMLVDAQAPTTGTGVVS